MNWITSLARPISSVPPAIFGVETSRHDALKIVMRGEDKEDRAAA
jgi:hypothetical protein